MSGFSEKVAWLVVLFACVLFLDWSDHDFVSVSTVSDVQSLPLSTRFLVEGEVLNPRSRVDALIFDLSNHGIMTCYFRHPPSLLFLFPHDWVVVRGSIVQTAQGRLCIVSSLEGGHAP